jgi:hypothetical protein
MNENTVTVRLELPEEQAFALAELTKRLSFSEIREAAVDSDEAYSMRNALWQLRVALAQAGFQVS